MVLLELGGFGPVLRGFRISSLWCRPASVSNQRPVEPPDPEVLGRSGAQREEPQLGPPSTEPPGTVHVHMLKYLKQMGLVLTFGAKPCVGSLLVPITYQELGIEPPTAISSPCEAA